MKKEELIPPKKDFANKVHEYFTESVKAITGGFFNPLIDYILPSSHQEIFEKWCENIYFAITELQERNLPKEDLLNDVEFVSLLKECLMIASKTHQQEKHELLKTALLNHFTSTIDFDSKLLFVHLVDNLTLSHIYFINLIDRYSEEIRYINEFSRIKEIFKKNSLSHKISDASYRMLMRDLERLNLIAYGDMIFEARVRQEAVLSVGGDNPELPYITITDFGKEFLEYLCH